MDINKEMKILLIKEGTSITRLSEVIGVSRQALYSRINGDLKVSSLESILEALGYELKIVKKED